MGSDCNVRWPGPRGALLVLLLLAAAVHADRPRRHGSSSRALSAAQVTDKLSGTIVNLNAAGEGSHEAVVRPVAVAPGAAESSALKQKSPSMLERIHVDDGASEEAHVRTMTSAMQLILAGATPSNVEELQKKAESLYTQAEAKMNELRGKKLTAEERPADMDKLQERLDKMKNDCGAKGEPAAGTGKEQAQHLAECFQSAQQWWATLRAPMDNSFNKNTRLAEQDAKNREMLYAFLSYDPMVAVNADLVGMSQRLLESTKALHVGINNLVIRGGTPAATEGGGAK